MGQILLKMWMDSLRHVQWQVTVENQLPARTRFAVQLLYRKVSFLVNGDVLIKFERIIRWKLSFSTMKSPVTYQNDYDLQSFVQTKACLWWRMANPKLVWAFCSRSAAVLETIPVKGLETPNTAVLPGWITMVIKSLFNIYFQNDHFRVRAIWVWISWNYSIWKEYCDQSCKSFNCNWVFPFRALS